VNQLAVLEDSLRTLLDALPDAVTVQDPSGELVYANEAAARVVGFDSPEAMLEAGGQALIAEWVTVEEDGKPLSVPDLPGRKLLRGEEAAPMVLRAVHRATGRLRWTRTQAVPITDADGELAFAVNLIEDITAAKLTELRQRVLAQAGQLLSGTPDLDTTFQRVASLAVPEVAQWCAFDVPDGLGGIRLAALAHADPEKEALGREMRDRYPPDLQSERGVSRALAGETEFYPDIPIELLEQTARDEEHLRLVREVGIRSAIIVPVRSGEQILGALTLVDSARSFTPADLAFAEDLGRRVGQAIAMVQLFEQRSFVARTLQAALLPPALPSVPEWKLASLFRPSSGTEVGGDFYDLFFAPESWWLVIGDVCGRGATAAALTSMVRYSLRSAAQLSDDPSTAVAHVNRVLLEHGDMSLCTLALLRVDRGGGTRLLSAGHPPAALLDEGGLSWGAATGPLLGAYADATWEAQDVELSPGASVVLYTDGVLDLPGSERRFGQEGLAEALASPHDEPGQLLADLETSLDSFAAVPAEDDAAAVCARRL
jgi:PAS domain S-box-containing protein